jgi:hypothetical protein
MMRERKYKPKSDDVRRQTLGFCLKQMMVVTAFCSAIILSLCNSAYSRNTIRRGDEVLVKTQDGTAYQGKLRRYSSQFLVLHNRYGNNADVIPREDITTVYRIRRHTGTGILIGLLAGTVAGFLYANDTADKRLEVMSDEIERGVVITIGAATIGGIVGGILGYNSKKLHRVQIETIPLCFVPSGDNLLIKVNFAIGF